jgi:hypothetical protein
MYADGVDSDIISDGLRVVLSGGGTAGNQSSPDAVSALTGSVSFLHYQGSLFYSAGIRRERLIFLPFSIESVPEVPGYTGRLLLLCRLLSFFGVYTNVDEYALSPSHPESFFMSLSPNPFNSILSVNYDIPENGTLEIFDISGRLLEKTNLSKGSGVYSYRSESKESGIVLIRLSFMDKSSTQKAVLIK